MPWPAWADILELIKSLGLFNGIFVIFFFMMHGWVFMLYRGRINDRQKEIDRIAAENREYRERFTKLLDRHYEVTDKKQG